MDFGKKQGNGKLVGILLPLLFLIAICGIAFSAPPPKIIIQQPMPKTPPGLISSAGAGDSVTNAMLSLCQISRSFLGVAVFLLLVLAGATYAIGQIMGAETRARAVVWATAMISGAVIGVVIYAIAPIIVKAIYSGAITNC